MRFMMMHRTNAHWEAGAAPSLELIARVGKLMGAMAEARVLVGAEAGTWLWVARPDATARPDLSDNPTRARPAP